MDKILYLTRGLPGSGKTTLAHQLTNSHSICEADKFFYDKEGNYNWDGDKLNEAHNWCVSEVKVRMMDNARNEQFYPIIVVSNTFTMESEMEPYIELAKKYGYIVISLILENRHGSVSKHNVPIKSLNKMEQRLRQNIKLR